MCLKGKEWSPLEGCLEAGDLSSQAPRELRHHWSLGQTHIKEALGFSLCWSLAQLRSRPQEWPPSVPQTGRAGGEHIQRSLKSQPR